MTQYFYLDVSLELSEKSEPILPVYFKGSIQQSLLAVFGEIGGQTDIDLLKFDQEAARGILRVPESHYVRLRAALTLISRFQDVPCRFRVHKVSPVLLSLISSHIDFD